MTSAYRRSYVFGQNASLMPRLAVRGAAGSSVTITPGELVNQDGTVDRRSVGGGQSYWKYTLAGGQRETCGCLSDRVQTARDVLDGLSA